MSLAANSLKIKANRLTVAALSLLMTAMSPAAFAQEYTSTDVDSLLPPEVVPLDPSAASSLSAQQAQKRQLQSAEGNVPGLVTSESTGLTAQEYRKAAFDSLYGQGQVQQQQQPQPWRAGQMPVGQNPMANPTYAPYQQQQQATNTSSAQSQMLCGGTKNKPKIYDTRRGGFSNGLSAAAAFGAGALCAGAMIRPNPAMGLGMMGLTMTGFGVRNAFRF
jgi:hypothetical protein